MKVIKDSSKISYWWNSIKMHTKLFIVYVVITIIPLSVVSIILVGKAASMLENEVERNYISAHRQVTTNIQNELDSYMLIADALYFNPLMNSLLHRQNKFTIDHKIVHDEVEVILESQLGQRDEINRLIIYLNNPYLFKGGYIRHIDDNLKDSQVFKDIIASGFDGLWSRTIPITNNNQYLKALSDEPNIDNNIFVYGYSRDMNYINRGSKIILSLSFKEEDLYKYMNKRLDVWKTYVVDNEGFVISSTDRSMVTMNIYSKNIQEKSMFHAVIISDEKSGLFDWSDSGGEKFKVFYEQLSNNWKVISIVPLNYIMIEKRKMIRLISFVIGISIIIAILLLTKISSLIAKRIDILLSKMEKMVPGKEISDMIILPGSDEISQLDQKFNEMHKRANDMVKQMFDLEIKKRESELEALQANINPHFLYNCLSTVSWMTYKSEPEQIREVLGNIAKFYRLSINRGHDVVTISQEIEHLKAYVEIEKYRTRGKMSVYYFIDESVENQKLPKMILQPIVENSIKHGMGDTDNAITVLVKIKRDGYKIVIDVSDDGVGVKENTESLEELVKSNCENYGVENINQRIKLYFGEQYGLVLKPGKENGMTTTIIIPYKENL